MASGLRMPKYLTILTRGQKPQYRTDKRPERYTFSNVRGIVLRQRKERREKRSGDHGLRPLNMSQPRVRGLGS